MGAPTIFLIPAFPFPPRIEILLTPKSRRDGVAFRVVDTAKSRWDRRSCPWPPRDEERPSATDTGPGE
ncbi:MAG: hypothetical protein IPG84_02235 [Betaproteobacteria bacterium]|nr:hypothetical protein [Betaproteobacteria bacterium]